MTKNELYNTISNLTVDELKEVETFTQTTIKQKQGSTVAMAAAYFLLFQ